MLVSYLYPSIAQKKWNFRILEDEDRFQYKHNRHLECGFHVMNFARAAIADVRINNDYKEFIDFKSTVAQQFTETQRL